MKNPPAGESAAGRGFSSLAEGSGPAVLQDNRASCRSASRSTDKEITVATDTKDEVAATGSSIRFRLHPWGNIHTGDSWFGIQAKLPGERRWFHCRDDAGAILYRDKAAAQARLKALQAAPETVR